MGQVEKLDSKITLGIFGGSFDPPHIGHYKLCYEFQKKISSKVLVMPTKISPFKRERMVCASDKDRLQMCKLAFSSIENVEISDYEILKNDVSYTYKTVEHFLSLNPEEKICLCIGADCLESLDSWANAEYLFKNCIFAAAYRYKDAERSFGEALERLRIKYNAQIIPLYYEPLEISSTDVRMELYKEDNVENYLNPDVYDYIIKNDIYGGNKRELH
jgi:nicotinate-nucleotide adenylyltransferase